MKRYLFILILFQFQYNLIFGQNITGKISCDNDIPAAGASVLVKGTTIGTISDKNGKYQITVDSTHKTLCFSYIGYNTQEISIKDKTIINVNLEKTPWELETLIINGFIQHGKKELIAIESDRRGKNIDTIAYRKGTRTKVLRIEKLWKNVNLNYEGIKHIYNSINYPDSAILNEIEGILFAEFVIGNEGQLTDLKIYRGFDILNNEVKKALKSMPILNQPEINSCFMDTGISYPGSYILPVEFKIIKEKKQHTTQK